MSANNRESCSTGDDQSGLLPHRESWDRMLKLPAVDITWQQTQNFYGPVKDYNPLPSWAFGTAEDVVPRASISAPLLVEQTLAKGIDRLDVGAPIIKEQPQEIYNHSKSKVLGTVESYTEKVCELQQASQQKATSLKEPSSKKADELAERLLDYYFPKCEGDDEDDNALTSVKEDHTVGRLSNKVARRDYRTVSKQVKSLRKEDVKEYVVTSIAVLRLTQYLSFLNDKRNSRPWKISSPC
ncbi:AAEL004372-PA [Aedes aegypti]|uniref:AAEL004372-PA n=1 Tax=Aedes aegypti TaxID=7159 RepID=Q17D04_AEDAE|nr:AAEL004372-PA [Aedes aegypti]